MEPYKRLSVHLVILVTLLPHLAFPQDHFRQRQGCEQSMTTMNGGRPACSGHLIFNEEFNDLEQWNHDLHIAAEPDFEFVVYKGNQWTVFTDNGILNLRASLIEDRYGPGFVNNGTLVLRRCTATRNSNLCSRRAQSYNVLPPVRSGRIHTKQSFSFRYGELEMRVKGPRGDWMYPELILQPAESSYGPWLSSGEIRLPSHLGNKHLKEHKKTGWRGRQLMKAEVVFGAKGDIAPTTLSVEGAAPADAGDWGHGFHIIRLKWTPDEFSFTVDGQPLGKGTIPIPTNGFASLAEHPSTHPWSFGGKNAPFDSEFFITLGLGVGGINRFPDNVTNGVNGAHPKPWKNGSPKAMLNFWRAKDDWFGTWEHPTLQVSYIKVWAL